MGASGRASALGTRPGERELDAVDNRFGRVFRTDCGVRAVRANPRLGLVLAHLHVIGCPCSRCRTARNYARLLATVTDSPPAEPCETVTAEGLVALFYAAATQADTVLHA